MPDISPMSTAEMTLDSRQQPAAALGGTNGVAKTAAPPTSVAPRAPRALPAICYTLRRKVLGFLEVQTDDAVLRNTQARARESMAVIEEALRRYGCVATLAPRACACHCGRGHSADRLHVRHTGPRSYPCRTTAARTASSC